MFWQQSPQMAFDYCCSLGLQMAELTTVKEMQAALKGILK